MAESSAATKKSVGGPDETTSDGFEECVTEMEKLQIAVDALQHSAKGIGSNHSDEDSNPHSPGMEIVRAEQEVTPRRFPGKLSPTLLERHEMNRRDDELRLERSMRRPLPMTRKSASALQPSRRLYSSDLTVGTIGDSRPSQNPPMLSPNGPTGGRVVDTKRSLRRYSLFGANVAPFWEYYTGIQGVIPIASDTPNWKVTMIQKKNCQVVHSFMRKEEEHRRRREFERIEQERRTCVPEWMREIASRRRRKLLNNAPQQSSNHSDSESQQKMKESIPPWKQELIMKKRKQLIAERMKVS